VPAVGLVALLTIGGCIFLFANLPLDAILVLPAWTAIGVLIYFAYGYRHSHLGRGIVEVHEPEIHDINPTIPGVDEQRDVDPNANRPLR
jgi:APA family basic amino acid/polyamine antiporter